MKFKLTTFNLRLNTPNDGNNAWPYRLKSVVHYINESKPLLIGTQEVLDDMLEDLNHHLTNYSHIGLTRTPDGEASAIFFNHDQLEVIESGTFWLSETPKIPNSRDYNSCCVRVCTWAEFCFKTNRTIRFRVFNTHLDHVSSKAKIEGIKTIVNKMNAKYNEEQLPTILMGDFNSTINDEVIIYLKDEQTRIGNKPLLDAFDYITQEEYGATFHYYSGITLGHPIDHIFVSNDIKIHHVNIFKEQVFNIFPSDHYPVSAFIELEEAKMKHCYHTHNERCGHATGTIRDFVVHARKLNYHTIGFCDHVPFKDGRIPGMRMDYSLIYDYIEEINHAKHSFNDITILSGFECEYFSDIHDYYVELKHKVDYLILGQHYVKQGESYTGNASLQTPELLLSYVSHIEEALNTHLFTLLAHPDSFGLSYQQFDDTAILATHRIAQSARKNHVALELNCNGFRRKNAMYVNQYPYPIEKFWEIIAKDYPDIPILITQDAHVINHLNDDAIIQTYEFARKLALNIVEELKIRV